MKLFGKILLGIIILVVAFAIGIIATGHVLLSVNENNLPKFVSANVVDLAKIHRISKFRSGAGHSYTGVYESCRSMKHYLDPTVDPTNWHNPTPGQPGQPLIDVFAPTTGTIFQIQTEHTPIGKQIWINSDQNPAYYVILFHVYPVDSLHVGSKVTAGEKIGYIGSDQQMDVAIMALTWRGPKDVSFFNVMQDNVFADYTKHGITARSEMIISKQERDANPLTCNGEMFSSNQYNPTDWVELK